MPTVKLLKPVRHNGENLVPGDEIKDLDDRAADRLVSFKAAEIPIAALDIQPGDGLTEEEVRKIKAMKKDELQAALKEASVPMTGKETVPVLKEMLAAAWAEPESDAAGA